MENLSTKKCIPCQGGIPPLTEEEVKKYLPQIKEDWEVLSINIGQDNNPPSLEASSRQRKLHKEFKFNSFKEAIDFTNKVAEIAESENHHPNILINYNKVSIDIWTHKIDGLHENDFILAAKMDNL